MHSTDKKSCRRRHICGMANIVPDERAHSQRMPKMPESAPVHTVLKESLDLEIARSTRQVWEIATQGVERRLP